MASIMTPAIHLNGTSKEELIRQFAESYDALNAAYAVMKNAAPNGRDYYPVGPQALDEAVSQHMDRLQRIDDVMAEFSRMIELIGMGRCGLQPLE